jgi:hypothetical protein
LTIFYKKGEKMKNFIIIELKKDYKVLITLLNYEVPISKCLKEIKLNDKTEQKILVDSLLCSGENEYRFIEMATKNGIIDVSEYKYIEVDNNIKKIANDIIKTNKNAIENSILTKEQKRNLIK